MRITKTFLSIALISFIYPAFGQDITPAPEIDPPPELPTDGNDIRRDDGTSIEGDLNTSNSNNGNVSKTYNGAGSNSMPVSTAISPSLMSSGSESCLQSISGGVQLVGFGLSSGKYVQDTECNRRRNAITLSNMGLKIAAVSIMCQNADVWRAMLMAATPCPVVKYGKIIVGKRAMLEIKQRPELLIPDYLGDKEFYDAILGMGVEIDEAEAATGSLSDRYRTGER
jgi:hypothetical protein